MKKLKVMYEKPEVTHEELEKFMDFDQLLVKQAAFLKRRRLQQLAGTATAVVAVALLSWWFVSTPDDPVSSAPNEELVEIKETVPNVPSVDSMTIEEKNPEPVVEIKSADTQIKKAIKEDETKEEIQKEETEPVYVQSAPVQGYAHLYDYFDKTLVYPEEAIADSIQGTVTANCLIGKDGKPKNIQIENSLGEAFDKEVIRIITNMPEWTPASLNGVPMDSKISLPLSFKLKPVNHDQ